MVWGNRKGGRVFWFCLFVCLFLSAACLALRKKPEDTEEILPCSFISNPLIISKKESWDSRRVLEVFKLDNPASLESDLLFSDI